MKTTPTLGLKLYDGTDAPDLVSGYNASMETLDGSGVLAFQGTVQDSTDWDTIIDAGYYNCNNTKFSSANHSPVGSPRYGVLVVYNRCDSPYVGKCATQIYYPHAGDAPVSRAYYSNAWSEWAPLVDVPDVEGALPANGAAGQVLVKSSASDYDCEWMDPSALDTMVAYDGDTKRLLVNGTEVAALKMPSIEGLEQLNGRNPVGVSSSVTISENHAAGEDFNNLVNAGVEVVTFNGGGAYPVFISYSLASSSGSINNMPAIGAIAMPNDISITITAILPVPKPQSTEILAIPLIITVRKAYKSVVQLSSNDAGYTTTNNGIRVTPFVYSIGEAS
ncbi:pyocin knob domain-containing protein [uncultured Bifidobacterium sp.]|uniref:pyocin knob domain-containing protein n=1 Tax=uncultured Bifidobacterium sp. TaxID=165187 RepID=UPI0025929D55|nr:pyocin knob domain-containing protein [uncultured Bifidobacterium sp.]